MAHMEGNTGSNPDNSNGKKDNGSSNSGGYQPKVNNGSWIDQYLPTPIQIPLEFNVNIYMIVPAVIIFFLFGLCLLGCCGCCCCLFEVLYVFG